MGLFSVMELAEKLSSGLSTQNVILAGIAVLLAINLKGLPCVWHIRLFRGLATQLFLENPGKKLVGINGSAPRLFSYLVTTHRNPPIECDYNMHKSNSTFFSDLDINRSQLLVALFNGIPRWSPTPGGKEKRLMVALGGTSCVFKREIKPFQAYEVWSRVLTWDEKWLYIVSYFVKKGTGKSVLKAVEEKEKGQGQNAGFDSSKAILASSVSRYVFKYGRMTVPPESVLTKTGLYPDISSSEEPDKEDGSHTKTATAKEKKSWDLNMFEAQKVRGLEAAMLFQGSDAVGSHFEEMAVSVLGKYADI
ncbi:predicted protein [Uncinocarpus reesii 1704]|uniref:Capsule polysaccharide biosynthesis protein n=1 Tax=Uncinocarpus reesii (strain UAMH 1704) TaxID=336963 RepID=C4JP83_UNCRE|nr:uncharacterized protein UREG_04465 [Uncinocarpus reesii 1704]EEP79619.1 predicted protein [Uncinocarpus reesii 1704]